VPPAGEALTVGAVVSLPAKVYVSLFTASALSLASTEKNLRVVVAAMAMGALY
jgi:hypothetical protein